MTLYRETTGSIKRRKSSPTVDRIPMLYESRGLYLITFYNPEMIERAKQTYRFLAMRRIQRWWIEIYYNPYHPVGLKNINRVYDRLYADRDGFLR